MIRVAIVGTGMTRFGHIWEKGLVELAAEAGLGALQDSLLERKQVKSLYVGNMSAGLFTRQEHTASLIAGALGMTPIPSTRVEAACASGAVALRQAYLAIRSGAHDTAMAIGVEKMTDVATSMSTRILSVASSQEYEASIGATFPGLYALLARMHMSQYGTKEEQLAMVAVKNHKNAMHNPYAHLRKRISVEDVMASQKIADPIKLLDCAPVSDGAAAVMLASEKAARQICREPVWIEASSQASDTISLHDRESLTTLKATTTAAKEAFSQAGITKSGIDSVELHDCFTIAEILALEDLGFAEKGKGGMFIEEGHAEIGGMVAANASGGLKAKGHPIGASGIAQAVEAAWQLTGKTAKKLNPETVMTHSVGGSGATAVVHIFKRQ